MIAFCFRGADEGSNSYLSLPKETLQAKPESLLTCLASPTWNQAVAVGETPLAIVCAPLAEDSPIREYWHASMIPMIKALYLRSTDSTTKVVLPQEMQLESALKVLEYFGLPVADPRTEMDLSAVDLETRIRAKIFLNYQDHYQEFFQRVAAWLEQHPQEETKFVITKRKQEATQVKYVDILGRFLVPMVFDHPEHFVPLDEHGTSTNSPYKLQMGAKSMTETFERAILSLFQEKGLNGCGFVPVQIQCGTTKLSFPGFLVKIPLSPQTEATGVQTKTDCLG